jgi:hypothetical protein
MEKPGDEISIVEGVVKGSEKSSMHLQASLKDWGSAEDEGLHLFTCSKLCR